MSKIAYTTAAGAGSIVVALAMAASVGAASLDDALLTVGTKDVKTKGKITVVNDATFDYPVKVDSNEIMFGGIKTSGTKNPVIDFGTGGTKISSKAPRELTVEADHLLNLNPKTAVQIGGGNKLSFDGALSSTIELFSAGSKVIKITGENGGTIGLDTFGAVNVSARKGLTVTANGDLGSVGNGVVTNTVNLGKDQTENVAVTATFIAAVDLNPGDVVVLDETATGRNDYLKRVTTTTTADDDATIGVVVNDNAVGAGNRVTVAVAGIARVKILGNVVMGAELGTSTTAGSATTTTTAPSATVMNLGIALENGSTTGKVAVLIDKR